KTGAEPTKQGSIVDVLRAKSDTPVATPTRKRTICFGVESQSFAQNSVPSKVAAILQLGDIEAVAHIEYVTLSDNPSAAFADKGAVRRLDFTGYDMVRREGTIALASDEMTDAGFKPGDQLMLRQVDQHGNPSDVLHAALDGKYWAMRDRTIEPSRPIEF